jgi:MFS family permease
VYFVFMLGGAFAYRVPPSGWKPAGWSAAKSQTSNVMITSRHVHLSVASRTRTFWLLWAVLMLNVSAGIGIIGMASPLLQEVFGGRLIGVALSFNELSGAQKGQIAAIAAGFTGLLSLFNIGGRFFWASLSDYIGRKMTYLIFFVLGFALYASIPSAAHAGLLGVFVLAFCLILSMYGGGFATIPAYLADMFGTQMVGAIHGRLLTAWATAGVLGPVLVNYIREYQIANGVPKAQAYDVTMYILSGMLILGFICNLMVKPVADKDFMTDAELAEERRLAHDRAVAVSVGNAAASSAVSSPVMVGLAWAAVGIPLAIGVGITLQKAAVFFK